MVTNSPERYQEVLTVATSLYRDRPNWVKFFREVLGSNGIIRQAFSDPEKLKSFRRSSEYGAISQMLSELRRLGGPVVDGTESTRVITVRLPKSLHETLKDEASEQHTSMNKLCITKLLQAIGDDLIPEESAQEAIVSNTS